MGTEMELRDVEADGGVDAAFLEKLRGAHRCAAGNSNCDYDRYGSRSRRVRGISFEQIIAPIGRSKLVQVLEHPNVERYPNQFLYEGEVDGYVHVVPVVREGRILFLKTIYPSRQATRRRRKGEP